MPSKARPKAARRPPRAWIRQAAALPGWGS
jgi:hypothetical protein